MSAPLVVAATVALIALSAFFVAVEFALIAAKPHRLEDAASRSRSGRAALRSSTELTLLLAGSQLGITLCTLALGAITKPAVHHWLTPLFESWGMPTWPADIAGFVLALVIVTFLHLVVGEMAPKSWAIAHPERAATLLALPMRAFLWPTRPLLRLLNEAANWVLRRFGVQAVDEVASVQDPDALRHLVEHSAEVGVLDADYSRQLSEALRLQSLSVRDLLPEDVTLTSVPAGASAADVRAATRSSGHLRILVGSAERPEGVVHVRDTLPQPDDAPIADLVRPLFYLDAGMPVYTALTHMRESSTHLAVVRDGDAILGVVSLADVLRRLFPESDPEPVAS